MHRGVGTTVFRTMVHEEWRLHAALFGGRRFAGYPVLIGGLGVGAVWLLGVTGTTPDAIARWLHVLVLVFGLYTGSSGLVGRDAIRDLLGGVTLVVFSARTLPISPRELLGLFLLKDVAYYAGLFLAPLTVAYAPAAAASGILHRLPLLWLSLVGTFVVGLVVTFGMIAARTRHPWGTIAVLAAALAVGLAWVSGTDLLAFLPYGFYREPGSIAPLIGAGGMVVLGIVALAAFDPTYERPSRTAQPQFRRWQRRLRYDPDGLLAKSLLDVHRSSGGYGKVLFSGGILFAVTAALVELAGTITGTSPSTGLSFGAILALSSFTTYNWVTQFDDLEAYLAYPLDAAAVFEAKFRAFIVLGLPTAFGYYLLALWLWGEGPWVALAGGALLGGLALYLFGLTVALAGLDPNAFLFDTVRFGIFTLGASMALVPLLVVAFVVVPTTPWLAGLTVAGLILGAVGVGLFRRAIPRWAARYRRG